MDIDNHFRLPIYAKGLYLSKKHYGRNSSYPIWQITVNKSYAKINSHPHLPLEKEQIFMTSTDTPVLF